MHNNRNVHGSLKLIVGVLFLVYALPLQSQTQVPTRSTHTGPEYQTDAPSSARFWQEGDPGQRLHLRGRVTSTSGSPLVGAGITLRQADGAGEYHGDRYRAQLFTGDNGEFRLTTAVPGQYYGLKHIHVMISHPDYQPLTTQILFKGDPALLPENEDLAILLEEVRHQDGTIMVGSVEFVLEP